MRSDAVLAGLERPSIAEFITQDGGLQPLSLGDIHNGQKDQIRVFAIWREASGVEHHTPRVDRREVVLDLEVVDLDRLLQNYPQGGDVLLAVAEVMEETTFGLVFRCVKRLVEGGDGLDDPEASVEDQ